MRKYFKCLFCGRFSTFIRKYEEAHLEFMGIILVWICKHCGLCEEGTQ